MEILVLILRYLSGKDLARIAKTSSKFRKLACAMLYTFTRATEYTKSFEDKAILNWGPRPSGPPIHPGVSFVLHSPKNFHGGEKWTLPERKTVPFANVLALLKNLKTKNPSLVAFKHLTRHDVFKKRVAFARVAWGFQGDKNFLVGIFLFPRRYPWVPLCFELCFQNDGAQFWGVFENLRPLFGCDCSGTATDCRLHWNPESMLNYDHVRQVWCNYHYPLVRYGPTASFEDDFLGLHLLKCYTRLEEFASFESRERKEALWAEIVQDNPILDLIRELVRNTKIPRDEIDKLHAILRNLMPKINADGFTLIQAQKTVSMLLRGNRVDCCGMVSALGRHYATPLPLGTAPALLTQLRHHEWTLWQAQVGLCAHQANQNKSRGRSVGHVSIEMKAATEVSEVQPRSLKRRELEVNNPEQPRSLKRREVEVNNLEFVSAA
jgi:hypothetical protein